MTATYYIKAVYQQYVRVLETLQTLQIGLKAARTYILDMLKEYERTSGFHKLSTKKRPMHRRLRRAVSN